MVAIDDNAGELDPTSPYCHTIYPPSHTYFRRFGASVVTADVMEDPASGVAFGDEILIGAPEGTVLQSEAGTVFIYRADVFDMTWVSGLPCE